MTDLPEGQIVRILLVEDHEVVRAGLKMLLEQYAEVQIVGEAATAEEAVSRSLRHEPDVVLLDLKLKEGTGIEACRRIREALPRTKVLVLTAHAEEGMVQDALRAGAAGYVLKEINGKNLYSALMSVAAGEVVLDRVAKDHLVSGLDGKVSAVSEAREWSRLSKQELRVAGLVAKGKTNKEIATEMRLHEKTVKNYLSNLMQKLHVTRRSMVAALHVRHAKGPGRPLLSG